MSNKINLQIEKTKNEVIKSINSYIKECNILLKDESHVLFRYSISSLNEKCELMKIKLNKINDDTDIIIAKKVIQDIISDLTKEINYLMDIGINIHKELLQEKEKSLKNNESNNDLIDCKTCLESQVMLV